MRSTASQCGADSQIVVTATTAPWPSVLYGDGLLGARPHGRVDLGPHGLRWTLLEYVEVVVVADLEHLGGQAHAHSVALAQVVVHHNPHRRPSVVRLGRSLRASSRCEGEGGPQPMRRELDGRRMSWRWAWSWRTRSAAFCLRR